MAAARIAGRSATAWTMPGRSSNPPINHQRQRAVGEQDECTPHQPGPPLRSEEDVVEAAVAQVGDEERTRQRSEHERDDGGRDADQARSSACPLTASSAARSAGRDRLRGQVGDLAFHGGGVLVVYAVRATTSPLSYAGRVGAGVAGSDGRAGCRPRSSRRVRSGCGAGPAPPRRPPCRTPWARCPARGAHHRAVAGQRRGDVRRRVVQTSPRSTASGTR